MVAGNELFRTPMINAMKSVSNRRIWCVDMIPAGLVFFYVNMSIISHSTNLIILRSASNSFRGQLLIIGGPNQS